MNGDSNFDALLDLLAEFPEVAEDATVRGDTITPVTDERRREVVRRLRDDSEARLTLFTLALEIKRDQVDSTDALHTELQAFAAAVEERFDVALLETAAAHCDRFHGVPDGLLDGHEPGSSR